MLGGRTCSRSFALLTSYFTFVSLQFQGSQYVVYKENLEELTSAYHEDSLEDCMGVLRPEL